MRQRSPAFGPGNIDGSSNTRCAGCSRERHHVDNVHTAHGKETTRTSIAIPRLDRLLSQRSMLLVIYEDTYTRRAPMSRDDAIRNLPLLRWRLLAVPPCVCLKPPPGGEGTTCTTLSRRCLLRAAGLQTQVVAAMSSPETSPPVLDSGSLPVSLSRRTCKDALTVLYLTRDMIPDALPTNNDK